MRAPARFQSYIYPTRQFMLGDKMTSVLSAYKAGLKAKMQRHASGKGKKIPLAPVIGAAISGWLVLQKVMKYVNDPGYAGDASRAIGDLAANTLGFADDGSGNYTFSWNNIWHGLGPDFIPLAGGVLIHKGASKFGVNRAISAVPWFSI